MASKLGDSGGLMTWMRYRRWPFLGLIFAIVVGIIGAVIWGLTGLLVGLMAGLFLGAIIGLLMGRDKKMFPVTVQKILTYSSGDFEPGTKCPGRVVTQSFATGDTRAFVERRIVEYLEGTRVRQLPNFSLPIWMKDDEIRKLKVLQTDSNTFYPITYKNGVMMAHEVPVYQTGPDGKALKFKAHDVPTYVQGKDGKPIQVGTARAFDRTPEGDLIPDPNGDAFMRGTTTQVVFDTNVVYDEEAGGVKSIPKGMASKFDNERTQYTMAYRLAEEFNKGVKDFLEKYAPFIVLLGIMLVAIYTLITMSDMTGKMAGAFGQPLKDASLANLQAAQINAEVTQSLLKLGFNYNGTILCQQVTNRSATGPTPPPAEIPKIPFVS